MDGCSGPLGVIRQLRLVGSNGGQSCQPDFACELVLCAERCHSDLSTSDCARPLRVDSLPKPTMKR